MEYESGKLMVRPSYRAKDGLFFKLIAGLVRTWGQGLHRNYRKSQSFHADCLKGRGNLQLMVS